MDKDPRFVWEKTVILSCALIYANRAEKEAKALACTSIESLRMPNGDRRLSQWLNAYANRSAIVSDPGNLHSQCSCCTVLHRYMSHAYVQFRGGPNSDVSTVQF